MPLEATERRQLKGKFKFRHSVYLKFAVFIWIELLGIKIFIKIPFNSMPLEFVKTTFPIQSGINSATRKNFGIPGMTEKFLTMDL